MPWLDPVALIQHAWSTSDQDSHCKWNLFSPISQKSETSTRKILGKVREIVRKVENVDHLDVITSSAALMGSSRVAESLIYFNKFQESVTTFSGEVNDFIEYTPRKRTKTMEMMVGQSCKIVSSLPLSFIFKLIFWSISHEQSRSASKTAKIVVG